MTPIFLSLVIFSLVCDMCLSIVSAEYRHIQQYLSELLQSMADQKNYPDISYLTKDIHVWPDYHGNRSPLADPSLQGMVIKKHLFI